MAWAGERAREAGVRVRFHRTDIFSADLPAGPYDLVYDSGCLHHLPPHRRVSCRDLLDRVLAPGGHFGLACFASGAMGSDLPEEEFYRQGQLFGSLAYSPEELRWISSDLTEVEMRPMAEQPPVFGTVLNRFTIQAVIGHPPSLKPHLLSDILIESMFKITKRYAHRVRPDGLRPTVK